MGHPRIRRWSTAGATLLAAVFAGSAAPGPQAGYTPPVHTGLAQQGVAAASPQQLQSMADAGLAMERARPAGWALTESRRLAAGVDALKPQRPGMVDAYVLVAGMDSDPVFGREAREAARVLERRYQAQGRTILLAGTDGTGPSTLPMGSPANIESALSAIAARMDRKEDVLILYTTSHGAPWGIVYHDGDSGFGAISPFRLWSTLDTLEIDRAMVMISACYSGVFIPLLSKSTRVIATAASSRRPSFGCAAENDWTFFGDALVNRALRKPQPFADAAAEAQGLVAGWEKTAGVESSEPQLFVGEDARTWLTALDARAPRLAGKPVGRPAMAMLDQSALAGR
ncbi:C13 family peptidase [Sphingomonas sp. FW199]|uniref:C13 family peptidase n=1 Tax=Sphingomonas sp. FW199 TaxID=3400217 RepID=UPI003CFB2115